MNEQLLTRQVPLTHILALRTRVLRPLLSQRGELAHWEGDDAPTTAHFACMCAPAEQALGCATIMADPMPAPWPTALSSPPEVFLRLRGMAIHPDHQRKGWGLQFLSDVMHTLRRQHPPETMIWCNARERASSLYERAGFAQHGEHFDIPGVARHVVMWRMLAT